MPTADPPPGYTPFEWAVMDLRYAGASWRDIGRAVGARHYSCQMAVARVLDRLDEAAASEHIPTPRACLGCGVLFHSTGIGNRQCEPCREWAAQVDDLEIPVPGLPE